MAFYPVHTSFFFVVFFVSFVVTAYFHVNRMAWLSLAVAQIFLVRLKIPTAGDRCSQVVGGAFG
jgi:hypothetical protein